LERLCQQLAPRRFAELVEAALLERAREEVRMHSATDGKNEVDMFQVLRGVRVDGVLHWSVEGLHGMEPGYTPYETLPDGCGAHFAACGHVQEPFVPFADEGVRSAGEITCPGCLLLLRKVAGERQAPRWVKEMMAQR
jgi:hypothetical protein